MKQYAIFVCAVAASCGQHAEPIHLGDSAATLDNAITDGHETTLYPTVGLVLGVGGCTGTLIGPRTVVTAAHCLEPGVEIFFHLGSEIFAPERVVFHPEFQDLRHDIGLLRLTRPANVLPAIASRSAPEAGAELTFVGYGVTAESSRDFGEKRMAKNSLNGEMDATTFSVTGTGDGVGNVCHGDSGGPAFAEIDGVEQLVGTVSYGEGPCGTDATFTRVDAFVDWLDAESGGDLYRGPDNAKLDVRLVVERHPVAGNIDVAAKVEGDAAVEEVIFYADCSAVAQAYSPPYAVTINVSRGKHLISAIARSQLGKTAEATTEVDAVSSEGCSAAGGQTAGLLFALLLLPLASPIRRRLGSAPYRRVAMVVAAGLLCGGSPAPAQSDLPVPAMCQPQTETTTPIGTCELRPDAACILDSDCPYGKPCRDGRCSACTSDADCTEYDTMGLETRIGTGLCDTASGACIGCTTDGLCHAFSMAAGADFKHCGAGGACIECKSDDDCHLSMFKKCDMQTRSCSLCTDDSQCCRGSLCAATCQIETNQCLCASDDDCAEVGRICRPH